MATSTCTNGHRFGSDGVCHDCLLNKNGAWQPAFTEPGPGKDEVERAIASITGGKVPPNPDAPLVSAILHGWLLGAIKKPEIPIKVRDVLQGQDRDGNYLNHFIVVTESGIRIKVTVEPEEG